MLAWHAANIMQPWVKRRLRPADLLGGKGGRADPEPLDAAAYPTLEAFQAAIRLRLEEREEAGSDDLGDDREHEV